MAVVVISIVILVLVICHHHKKKSLMTGKRENAPPVTDHYIESGELTDL